MGMEVDPRALGLDRQKPARGDAPLGSLKSCGTICRGHRHRRRAPQGRAGLYKPTPSRRANVALKRSGLTLGEISASEFGDYHHQTHLSLPTIRGPQSAERCDLNPAARRA